MWQFFIFLNKSKSGHFAQVRVLPEVLQLRGSQSRPLPIGDPNLFHVSFVYVRLREGARERAIERASDRELVSGRERVRENERAGGRKCVSVCKREKLNPISVLLQVLA